MYLDKLQNSGVGCCHIDIDITWMPDYIPRFFLRGISWQHRPTCGRACVFMRTWKRRLDLGHVLTCVLADRTDIARHRNCFIALVNTWLINVRHLIPLQDIGCLILRRRSHCGCKLQHLRCLARRTAMRQVWRLPHCCHIYGVTLDGKLFLCFRYDLLKILWFDFFTRQQRLVFTYRFIVQRRVRWMRSFVDRNIYSLCR